MIDLVYKTLQVILNKENQGNVRPTQFNLVAKLVQNEIYRGYFEDYNRDKNRDNRGLGNPGISDLPFVQSQRIQRFLAFDTMVGGGTDPQETLPFEVYQLPSDVYLIEDEGISVQSTNKVVDEIRPNQINILRNTEVSPSATYPGYVNYGTFIRVYPAELGDLDIVYYRKPNDPNWTYESITNLDGAVFERYDPTNSSHQDFDMDEKEFSNIVIRMASYFGVNLREAEVVEIAESIKNQTNVNDNT